MEFGTPFSYPFKDPNWFKKFILPGLCMLIPVIGQFVLMGWMVEIVRRVINDTPDPLPELDFGGQLGKGFQAWVIGLVYSIPIFILVLPIQLVAPIGAAADMDPDTMATIMAIVSVCCGGLTLIYSILVGFLLPAAIGNFAAKGQLGAGLRFAEVFGLVKAAPVAYLIVLVGSILAGLIGQLGAVVCVVGLLVSIPFAAAIMGHFYGQAYKEATSKL